MKKEMANSVKITLIIVAAIVAVILMFTYLGIRAVNSTTIDVDGQATVKATPDLVVTYFNSLSEDSTAEAARTKNAEAVSKTIDALVGLGFKKEEIQTQDFSVYPKQVWTNGQSRTVGYVASQTLKLEIPTSDLSKIGDAIDAGINSGMNVNYINFELSEENQNKYKIESMKKATEDAKTKAEAIAAGLGKELGDLVSVSASDYGYNPWRMYSSAESAMPAKDAATQIQPSEQEITTSVSVVYEIN